MKFTVCEWLNMVNVVGQMYLMDRSVLLKKYEDLVRRSRRKSKMVRCKIKRRWQVVGGDYLKGGRQADRSRGGEVGDRGHWKTLPWQILWRNYYQVSGRRVFHLWSEGAGLLRAGLLSERGPHGRGLPKGGLLAIENIFVFYVIYGMVIHRGKSLFSPLENTIPWYESLA